ncbi:hypothetical protein BXY85_1209 [Roseivirga pacifica]|uniref:Uncharacterized protein n=2 Tax=Roseivirga pacifica TaxID=1267423 RepID=A0A1I0M9C5_9BACT|nr:hypothetical protein BXY85_1209 [Roseivirga pacifica]SEV84953.1 hypothetical protein SAMN05216290_0193 [Roseivirga pacifica]
MFGVSAGVDSLVWVSFVACILDLGLGSWLFLHTLKTGRLISIGLSTITLLMPVTSLVSLMKTNEPYGVYYIVVYVIFILIFGTVIIIHIIQFKKQVNVPKWNKVVLSTIPLGLLITYLSFLFGFS